MKEEVITIPLMEYEDLKADARRYWLLLKVANLNKYGLDKVEEIGYE